MAKKKKTSSTSAKAAEPTPKDTKRKLKSKVYEAERNGKKYEMYDDTVIAFNRSGKEIFRTQVEEPVYIRPAKHQNSI